MSDGPAEFSAMIRNAAAQSQFMQRASDIGLVQLWRTFRIVVGQDINEVWPGMKLVAVASQLVGVAALIYGAYRRDRLLMVGGMLWAAGNMCYYAMLYLLPVFVIERFGVGRGGRRSWSSELELENGGVDSSWSSELELERGGRWGMIEALLWIALLSPLQLVLLGHSANQVIGNLSLLGLMLLRIVYQRFGVRG